MCQLSLNQQLILSSRRYDENLLYRGNQAEDFPGDGAKTGLTGANDDNDWP